LGVAAGHPPRGGVRMKITIEVDAFTLILMVAYILALAAIR
jgi:hypothetical protein